MKLSRSAFIAFCLFLISLAIHFYSQDQERVESGYSNHFYIYFSRFFRFIFGSIPISIGDILYGMVFVWLFWKLFQWFISRKKNSAEPYSQRLIKKGSTFCIIFFSIYILFNIFWGINYNRKGVAAQLEMKMAHYNPIELKEMNCLLVEKINTSRQEMILQNKPYPTNSQLFKMVSQAYDSIEKRYPFLGYDRPSIKPALWGWLGNYAGFTGYYNPFTGEAQVNTTVPKFLLPFVACHEVAHQVGYAKEMEANFVGYLAGTASKEPLFQYSVYLDLFIYANRNLYRTDSTSAKLYFRELSPAVMNDLEVWRKFSRKYRNPAEPMVRWMYGKFLQGNQQPEGILAYDEVTTFIIAYYKKFGNI